MTLRRTAAALAAVLLLPVAAPAAETKTAPLTKREERAKFHPDAAPMPAADRLRGYERRLEMEAASPLSALKFRSVGPELQGGRIVAIEAPAAKPDTIFV